MTDKGIVIAIDIGGTFVKSASVDSEGRIKQRLKKGVKESKGSLIEVIFELIRAFMAGGEQVSYIGIGTAGFVLFEDGRILYSPNIPEWNDLPLRDMIQEETRLPVFLDNDVNAIAYGERVFGAGKEFKNSLTITLGTGLGGGLILNGQLWRGTRGWAGEIGHINIIPDGELCSCGRRGCLETYASATALVRTSHEALNEGSDSVLRDFLPDIRSRHIGEAAKKQDPLALSLFKTMGGFLGLGLSKALELLDLEAVIVGGGVSNSFSIFYPFLDESLKRHSYIYRRGFAKVVKARLGDDAGILGISRLAFEGCVD